MRTRRRGFALALAVGVLVAVTLVVALILDGAIAAFRSADADLELARAELAAESALATAFATRLDSGALHAPGGATLSRTSVVGGGDSVTVIIQTVSPPIVRIVVDARRAVGALRLSVGRLAFATLVNDSATPAELRISAFRDAWWVPVP